MRTDENVARNEITAQDHLDAADGDSHLDGGDNLSNAGEVTVE